MRRKAKSRAGSTLIAAILGGLVISSAGLAHHIGRHPFHGHVFCLGTYGFANELKVDSVAEGTYDDSADDGAQYGGPGPLVVTISHLRLDPVEGVMMFDWSSNAAVGAVLVQAGDDGLKFDYDAATGDSNVASPASTIDRISFCYYHHSAAAVTSFNARRTAKSIVVSWDAASEVGVLGYDLYRGSARKRNRLNGRLIRAGAGAGAHTYRWVDRMPSRRGRYWLRESDVAGSMIWHGPAQAS